MKIISYIIIVALGLFGRSEQPNLSNHKMQKIHYKKKMTPQGEDYLDSAAIQFSKSITINASLSTVWNIIDDSPGYPNWFPGVKWAKMEVETEKGVGSKRLAQLNSNKYYEEMIAYEKEVKWGFTMLESNSGLLETITEVIYLEQINDSTTKVVVRGGYKTRGLANLMKNAVKKNVDKTWSSALEGLKSYSEAQ